MALRKTISMPRYFDLYPNEFVHKPLVIATMANTISDEEISPLNQEASILNESNDDWTEDECLYIHLHFELVLAVAKSSFAPIVFQNASSAHKQFLGYFSTNATESSGNAGKTIRTLEDFIDKRNKLVPGVLWSIDELMKSRVKESGPPIINRVKITPIMTKEYSELRKHLGYQDEIPYPEKKPDLWRFLENAAQDQIQQISTAQVPISKVNEQTSIISPALPKESSHSVQAQENRNQDSIIEAQHVHNGVNLSQNTSKSSKSSIPSNRPKATASKPTQQKPKVAKSGPSTSKAASTKASSTASTQGQCTVIVEKTGKQCTRPRPMSVPESEHATWLCHIHKSQADLNVVPGRKRTRKAAPKKT